MTPEAKARQAIDALLTQAGWHVCDMADCMDRRHGKQVCGDIGNTLKSQEADRRLSLLREVESEVDANLKRAQALSQAVLSANFAREKAE